MYCNPNCNPARVAPLVALCAPGAGLSARAICDERCERFSGRVSPADAERMSSRVRIHLVTLGDIQIRSWL